MDRMCAYAKDTETTDKLREKIKTFLDNLMEELKTEYSGTKFEFYATMLDGIELMGLGASSFGRL